MRLYLNANDGAVSLSLFERAHLSNSVPQKRGDTKQVQLAFHRDGSPLDLDPTGTAATFKFGCKVEGDFDGSYVFSSTSFTKSNGTVFTDAATTSGSPTLTSASAVFTVDDVAKPIAGTGIVAGAYIIAFVNATTVTLSDNATATATGVTITITGRQPLYTAAPSFNTTKGNNLLGYDQEGYAEATEVRTLADVAGSLHRKYFVVSDNAGTVGVWIDVDNAGGLIPAGASACARAIEITTITTGMTAAQVATAIAAVIEADSKFTASASGNVITITDATIGTRANAADGDTGFGISTWIQGSAPNTMTNVRAVDLDAEVEWTIGSQIDSTQTFTLELLFDVNQGNEGVPASATPAYPLPAQIVTINNALTGYTGGTAADLDSIATTAIPVPYWLGLDHSADGLRIFKLVAGTDAEASPTVIRPDDYNGATNAKVWKLKQ